MDPLIRSARVDPLRTRLSEVRSDPQPDRAQTLRDEIESRLRAQLFQEAQEQYESARAKGLADGRASAIAEARTKASEELRRALETLNENLRTSLSAMQSAHQAAMSKLESSVGEVAFAAVCRLVSEQSASKAFVLGIVERTCAELRADLSATVRLHPRDIHVVRELLQERELRVDSLGLRVVPDESLELGGCVIEAASGQYDGGLESQLRRLHAILTGTALESGQKG